MPLELLTSFSPNPARIERQRVCLSSWQRYGWHVVAVQARGERPDLGEIGADIEWQEVGSGPPLLSDIWAEAEARTGPVLLLNSDLMITSKLEGLRELDGITDWLGDGLVCIRRWNHAPGQEHGFSMAERWGIDGFIFRATGGFRPFEGHPFRIGQPVWDWWLPLSYGRAGRQVYEITQRHLLHERHALGWDKAKWRENVRHAMGLDDDPKADDPRYLEACSAQVTDELRRILQPFPKKAA
jgi:hypothetical protein